METFDAIIVGAGSGLNIMSSLASQGKRVALVEHGPMGGTCLNRGCIPSKIVIHTADVMEILKKAPEYGIRIPGKPKIDFASITKRASKLVDKESREIEEAILEDENIKLFKTTGRFVGHKTLQVGKEKITAENIFILAGTRPSIPDIEGLEGSGYITSTEALRLTKQPKSMIVLGGGYIAAELAHFYGALGTKITVVQRSDVLLTKEDREISEKFTELFSRKYDVLTRHKIKRVEKRSGKFVLHAQDAKGVGKKIISEQLLVSLGVRPNTDILQAEKTGLKTDEKGYLVTDEYMETNVKGIWAAGDIAGKYLFKHSANLEAEYALYNFQNPQKKEEVNYTAMPHAIFSSPQIAGVGYTEEELKGKKIAYSVGKHNYKATGMGQALLENDGFVKILVDKKSRKILGCHILGPEASSIIHEVLVAMRYGHTAEDIANTVHIHPALSEVVQRAAAKVE